MRYANAVVKEYGNYVNIAVFNRNIVDDTRPPIVRSGDGKLKSLEGKALSDHKDFLLALSSLRARHKIFDIAMLNDWQYFVTFTFNDKIVDAHNYDESIKKVKKWCQNTVQRYDLRYLLVPELHPSSGRIHLHGLLAFGRDITLQATGHFDNALRPIFNLPLWRFGFSTIVRLDDNTKDRVARYITKYITKDLDKIVGNYYYAGGKGLKREPEKYYINIPYDDFLGKEYQINGFNGSSAGCKVKYNLEFGKPAWLYAFIPVSSLDSDLIDF